MHTNVYAGRPMHIMLKILPIMLCSNSLPLALLCPNILPIMPHYALIISLETHINGRYTVKEYLFLHSPQGYYSVFG